MKNNYKNILIILVLFYFFFSILFLRWFNINSFFLRKVVQLFVLCLFFLFYIFLSFKKNIKFNLRLFFVILLYFGYIILNVNLLGKKLYFTKQFLFYTILPLFSFIFVLSLNYDINFKEKFFKKTVSIFNIYYFINLIIMIFQILIPYFMMRHIPEVFMYEDQIDGLIGMCGTHILSFFCIFLILLNYINYLKSKNKFYLFYMIFVVFSSCIISLFNDNKSYYVLLLFIIFLIIFNTFKKNKSSIFFIFSFIIVLFFINFFFSTIDTSSSISYTYNYYKSTIINNSNTERYVLYKYALDNGNGYGIGMGIGSILDYGDPNLPKHFGLNNLCSLVYQGGLIYFVLTIVLYLSLALTITDKINFKLFLSILIFLLFVCYYTQPFSENYFSFFIGFIILELNTIINYKNLKGVE